MTRHTVLLRQYAITRQSRREISSSSPKRSSTSPQRYANLPLPATTIRLKHFNEIPGPLALPMLRHSAHVLPRIGNFHHTVGLGLLEGLRDRYGDLVRLAKGSRNRPVLYVFDPDLMQEVYNSGVTEPPTWEKSPLGVHRKNIADRCPIKGDDKAIWTAIRALLFDQVLLQNYEKAFDDIASDTVKRLGELRHVENALNEELETEIYRWALETLGMMIFGIRIGCLDGATYKPTPETRSPEMTSMDDHIIEKCSLSKRCLDQLTPAEQMVRCAREIGDGSYLVRSEHTLKPDSETFNNALKAFDRHYSLIEHFVQKASQSLQSDKLRSEQILFDKLQPLERRIVPLAADILLAGVDPLVQSAIWMLHLVSLNAAQQQRVLDEGAWAAASAECTGVRPPRPLPPALARESLRLFPATGAVLRRAAAPLALDGYDVPTGVDIVLAHGVTSKSEKEWGRAKAYIPERWCSDGPLQASRAHPCSSMPFGDSCPAAGAVEDMMAALIRTLLDEYRLEWQGPAPKTITTGVNKLQPPYYFVLQNAA